MIRPHRQHALWLAFILHRLSGVALALFLPLHFYVLSLALSNPKALDGFLSLGTQWWMKAAEMALVFCLAVHLFGGLRLMALEFLPWSPRQKTYAAGAVAMSFFIACLFLFQAVKS